MKTDYAMRALIDLASRQGHGPIQSAEIAGRQSIPEPYLDQLLTVLRKGGIIRSVRGPQGGHALAKASSQITLADVVVLLEGNPSPSSCLDRPSDCQLAAACAIREVWQDWQTSSLELLHKTTIADLLERQNRHKQTVMYHI